MLVALAGECAVAATTMTKFDVPNNSTCDLDIAGTTNTANNAETNGSYDTYGVNIAVGEGCTIRLTGAQGDGSDFTLNAAVTCRRGDLWIDGTELQGYSRTLRWCGCALVTNGVLKVKGFDKIVYGNTKKLEEKTTASVAINVNDVKFYDNNGQGSLVFTNTVTMCRSLATCPYEIAPGTVFWPAYNKALSAQGDTFAPDDWTLGIVNTGSVANAKIRVPDGFNLPFRPCSINFGNTRMGNWIGLTNRGLSHDIDLDGTNSKLAIWHNVQGTVRFTGDITGSGAVSFRGQSANKIHVVLQGRAGYTGKTTIRSYNTTSVTGNDIIVFYDPEPASSCLELGKALSATYMFHPDGYMTSNTVIRVNAFSGEDNNVDFVEVATNQTIYVGTVSGSIAFRGPESGLVVVDSLAADAHVRLLGGVRLKVNAVGVGADVTLGAEGDTESGSWHLYGPDDGEPVTLPYSETAPGGRIVLGGRLTLGPIWSTKVALWLDAEAEESFTYLRDVNPDATAVPTNGVLWWRDRRADQTTYAMAQARFKPSNTENINSNFNYRLYPRLEKEGPNGLNYIGLERSQSRLYGMRVGAALNAPNKEGCTAVPSKYAIAVMKCMDDESLGTSVFAGKTCDYYSRGGAGKSRPMFTNETINVYQNGKKVEDPTNTSFGSDWSICSFDAAEPVVGLACLDPTDAEGAGGFSFGEILLFSSMPTDEERMIAEKYLSDKWGLSVSYDEDAVIAKTLDFDVTGPSETALLTLGGDWSYDLTVNVDLANDLENGLHPLVTCGNVKSYTLGTVTDVKGRHVKLVKQDADSTSTLYLKVVASGLAIFIR